jgi:hypothetical protein
MMMTMMLMPRGSNREHFAAVKVRVRFGPCNPMPEPRAKAPMAGVLARAIAGWSELRYS